LGDRGGADLCEGYHPPAPAHTDPERSEP